MGEYYHSIVLDEKICMGCTNCIKKCPTEAIRVRKGKARIINERCIDCGECVKTCPYRAKVAKTDSWDMLTDFKYTIALPAPTLYAQFDVSYSRAQILYALKSLGFDQVYEVARGAEIVTEKTNQLLAEGNCKYPIISTACPAVVRLVQMKFPSLISNLLKIKSPMEMAAQNARREFCEMNNVSPLDVGVFFISPCAAKMTSVMAPFEDEKSNVNGVFSIKMVYLKMLKVLLKIKDKDVEEVYKAGYTGIRWAASGGEAIALKTERVLSVDGIHNVMHILDEIENDKLKDVDFIEAGACTGGCLGGPLTVENVFMAKTRNRIMKEDIPAKIAPITERELENCEWNREMEHKDISKLDADFSVAVTKFKEMTKIYDKLPALDCGACGAPSCKALAEDIVRGNAKITDCVFKLRERVRELALEMIEIEGIKPPVMDVEEQEK